ncbi:MAG: SpoIVB peptidase [Oscillospiraceae bacterium]|nr:SpoIVB peptidase [Oscillospiraceae bacterium]
MKKFIHGICFFLLPLSIAVLSAVIYYDIVLPEQFNVVEGQPFHLDGPVSAAEVPLYGAGRGVRASAQLTAGSSYTASLKLLGVFPVKAVRVNVVDDRMVIPCGTPFGIKLFTAGVMVVGMTDIDTAGGASNPAQRAGIKKGDVIEGIDGAAVNTNEEVAKKVEQSGGKVMDFRIRRNNITFDVRFTPARSVTENRYKAGIWVRDSSAGIGTLTFYLPAGGVYGGLGHPVCDVDTGEVIPVSIGEAVPAVIYDVTKGANGVPGELRGGFEKGSLGDILINAETGIYGHMTQPPAAGSAFGGKPIPVAMKQQVQEGPAQLLCTVSGNQPEWYDINITGLKYNDAVPTRNMVVEITDEALLEQTNGIVQGMSGSPIIQNGRLAGAITHVFINEPHKGYAIFAENMLKTAESVQDAALEPAA